MSGPESMHARLTSGDPGQVATTAGDLRSTMRDIAESVDQISLAAAVPEWESDAGRQSYNISAWTTRASAEVAHLRLNRALLAVRAVKIHHTNMRQMADDEIEAWRAFKERPGLDGFLVLRVRAETMQRLQQLADTFGGKISAAGDFLASAEPDAKDQILLAQGLRKSMQRDLADPGPLGPLIPNTLFTGDEDGGWIPQGLGYDNRSHTLLQTTYNGDRSQLQLIDPETGEVLNNVELGEGFDRHGDPLGQPNHAGGVSVHGDKVLVSSSSEPPRLFEYSLRDIRNATPGETVQPRQEPMRLPADENGKNGPSAFNTVDGDTLYVGTHDKRGEPGWLRAYEWDPDEGTRGGWVEQPGYPVPIPPGAQGMTVHGDEVVFSSSVGRGNSGELSSYDKSDLLSNETRVPPRPLGTVETPNMVEGIVMTDEGVLSTYESGTTKYHDDDIWSFEDDLWASTRMTVTPYDDLGIDGPAGGGSGSPAAGGIDAELPTLDRAQADFRDAETALSRSVGDIDAVSLPSGALGGVPEGPEFARLLTSHCDETSQWLADGRISAVITADGLAASARGYQETDAAIGGFLQGLQGGLP